MDAIGAQTDSAISSGAAAIADIDARINQLVGKREMLMALRDAGAVIEVPDAPQGDAPQGASA